MRATPPMPLRVARRGMPVLAAIVLLAAGLLAPVSPAQAKPGQAGRIVGGVEDGTFSPKCLGGSVSPNPGVLQGKGKDYRTALANGIGIVRILVPWNIAMNTTGAKNAKRAKRLACLENYMSLAHTNAKIEISLTRSSPHGSDPSPSAYTKAVQTLAHLKLGFSYVTAWNEPNNTSYLTDKHPASRAGHYFRIAHKIFGNKMVAGDFASGVTPSFLSSYIKALGDLQPRTWAIHPYTDITNFQYYMHSGMSPAKAGARAARKSKVLEFARELHAHHYGSGTRIWLNEINIDHAASKHPPKGVPGEKCTKKNKKTCTKFSERNQADAALFLSGALGRNSLPGVLKHKKLPQLTVYIYLRARDDTKPARFADVDVLEVKHKTCLYLTLAGSTKTPSAKCAS